MNLNRYMILINVKFLEIASSVEVKKKIWCFNFSLSREFKTTNYITLKIRC